MEISDIEKWFKDNPEQLTERKEVEAEFVNGEQVFIDSPVAVPLEEGLDIKYHKGFVTSCIAIIKTESLPDKTRKYYNDKLVGYINNYNDKKK